MAIEVRKIKVEDFQEVSSLFDGQEGNSARELMWLFRNHSDSSSYNAYIAIDKKNTIIGVIAYILTTYISSNGEIHALNPMSWMLKSGYKGLAGILLFKTVSEHKDIAITIGGADVSKKLYPMFNYKSINYVDSYYKILKPLQYYKVLKRKNFIKKIGMFSFLLPSYLKKIQKSNKIKLTPYNGLNFVKDKKKSRVLIRKISKDYIDWFLDCPNFAGYALVVSSKEKDLGMCLLVKRKIGNNYFGRIVHMPFLGDDNSLQAELIYACTEFLKKEECCLVSGLTNNNIVQKEFSNTGFICIKSHLEGIYVREKKQEIIQNTLETSFLQYSEGDIFLRNY